MLPKRLHEPLQQHRLRVGELRKKELSRGAELAPMTRGSCQCPAASSSGGQQFVVHSAILRPWRANGRVFLFVITWGSTALVECLSSRRCTETVPMKTVRLSFLAA